MLLLTNLITKINYMKKNDYSKRDYNKKIYWSGDKKDLRKSFPKWTMIAWALIDFTIGVA